MDCRSFCVLYDSVTYTDHNLLEQTQRELTQLQNQSPYARSFVGSFAYSNTVMAFGYLRDLSGRTVDPNSPCKVKITAPPENEAIKGTLASIASAFNCYVPLSIGTAETNPELRAEAFTTALPNVVLIHAAKDNSRSDGFVTAMGNSFHVQRTYDLPPRSPQDLVWVQIGSGSVWRKD